MELLKHVEFEQDVQKYIIDLIEEEENIDNLQQTFDDIQIRENKYDLIELLQLIAKVSSNYYRTPHFFDRIEQLILRYESEIKEKLSNSEIFKIFRRNKRLLLFLISKKILSIDERILNKMNSSKYRKFFYPEYFSPEIKFFTKKNSEEDQNFDKEEFELNRQKGENDEYICQLIQKDSVEDFIQYVNKKNIHLSNKIPKSIFETNPFLLKNQPTLIEYAAFYGSIEIFQFLFNSNANINGAIWLFAIHGKNPTIIHFLEDNHIEPADNSYVKCLIQSIKCHYLDFAEYFCNNYVLNYDSIVDVKIAALKYYNFFYFPNELNDDLFYFLSQYNYISLVDFYLKDKDMKGLPVKKISMNLLGLYRFKFKNFLNDNHVFYQKNLIQF